MYCITKQLYQTLSIWLVLPYISIYLRDPHLPISHLLVQYFWKSSQTHLKNKTTDQPSTPIMVNEVWPQDYHIRSKQDPPLIPPYFSDVRTSQSCWFSAPTLEISERLLSTITDSLGEIIPFLVSLSSLLVASDIVSLLFSTGKEKFWVGSDLPNFPSVYGYRVYHVY